MWPVIDLFSGAGGMSCGFARRAPFRLIAAVDAEHAKPCEGYGRLDCNATYEVNIGVKPFERDIARLEPPELARMCASAVGNPDLPTELCVLIACPPCTDFSRAKPTNHLRDSNKNSLVAKCADFVEHLRPEFVVMENARELISGVNAHHYRRFCCRLRRLGYAVDGRVEMMTRFGLPQIRERAVVIASRVSEVKTLDDLWQGWAPAPGTTTVRHAIGRWDHPPIAAGERDPSDAMHVSPGFSDERVRRRMDLIPHDGGSWFDLPHIPGGSDLLVPSMQDRLRRNDLGSHPDVYGRLAWDAPAKTIKRECAHVGNGRYAHPRQTRLLTVREMAMLQGFPADYRFVSPSIANRYRHVGDAVPPLLSYQLSALVAWMKTGKKPAPSDWVLHGSSLRRRDVIRRRAEAQLVLPLRKPAPMKKLRLEA